MTLPSSDSLFELAWQEAVEHCPIRLIESVEAALRRIDPKAVPVEIGDRAEGALSRTKRFFDDRIGYYRHRRLIPPIEWSKTDPERLVQVYPHTRHLPAVIEYLRRLDSYDFEWLIASLLRLAGAEKSIATPRIGDQGIDVIAKFNASLGEARRAQLGFQLAAGPEVYVLVQCKRRTDRTVSVADLREFVGATSILRIRGSEAQSLRGAASAVAMGFKPFSAGCLAYATTSTFDNGATKLAEFLDLVTLDGEGIAQALLDFGVLPAGAGKIAPGDFTEIGKLIIESKSLGPN